MTLVGLFGVIYIMMYLTFLLGTSRAVNHHMETSIETRQTKPIAQVRERPRAQLTDQRGDGGD